MPSSLENHRPSRRSDDGPQRLERLERQFCEAFPDARHAIDDLIAEGDRVVLRTTAQATHRGRFEGIEPTGRSVEFTGLVVYRIQSGSCGIMRRGRLSSFDP